MICMDLDINYILNYQDMPGTWYLTYGFRSSRVNALVGGVRNSQHLLGQAADIRPRDPK